MYERFITDLRAQLPRFPSEPTIGLGLAVKHIRLRMGMTQDELARHSKTKPSALKTFENGYAKFTKASTLEDLARVLRTSVRNIVLEGREWFPGSFFVLRLTAPEDQARRRASDETSFKRKILSYPGFSVDFSSPPPVSPAHFCFVVIEITPGGAIHKLRLPFPNHVAGLLTRGTLKVVYDSKHEINVFGNQGFMFRGDKVHDLVNLDQDNAARLCLAFTLAPSRSIKGEAKPGPVSAQPVIGRAINQIRHLYADSNTRPLTFAELSYLTGLEEKSLQYLEQTTKPDQVIYWDKIEKITQALKMPITRFLDLAEGKDEGYFHLATAHDRALIDYRHYLGVRIKSALFPSASNHFHISETYIEPKGGLRRSSWKRTDEAMIAVYIEDGELVVEVGKNRKARLTQGESVYFDGRLGYIFTNPGTKPAKLFIATYPAIIF